MLASACERCSTRRPGRAGGRQLDVGLADRRGDHDGVLALDVCRVVTDVDLGAFRREGGEDGCLLGVGAADGAPAREHHPGHPGHPRTPDGDEVDRPELVQGRDRRGEVEAFVGAVHRCPGSVGPLRVGSHDEVGQQLVGAPLPRRRRGRRHRVQPSRVGDERDQDVVDPLRGERRVVDEQATAGGHDVGGVEPLLPVADRQRHVDGRQAHRGQLAHRVGAGPGDHEVGRGVGEVHAVGVGRHDVGRARRRSVSGANSLPAPVRCSTCTPAARSAGTRASNGRVEPLRAERAAGDQHRRPLRVRARSAASASGAGGHAGRAGRSRAAAAYRSRWRGRAWCSRRSSRRTGSSARRAGWPDPAGRSARAPRSGRAGGGRRGRQGSRRSRRSRRPPRPRTRSMARSAAATAARRLPGSRSRSADGRRGQRAPWARSAAGSRARGRAWPPARSRCRGR